MDGQRHTYVVACEREGCGTINKLVTVEQKSHVLVQAKRAFAVTGDFRVEYFYEPASVFVEVDSLDELPDGGKVRIIPLALAKSSASSASPSTASTVAVLDLQPDGSLILKDAAMTPVSPLSLCPTTREENS